MAGFDDIARKATEFVKSEKVQKVITSDKAEQISDRVLDGAAGLANKVTKGKHADKIAGARKAADEKLGRDGEPGTDRRDGDDPHGELGPDGTPRPH